jgi:hypothetical protein
VRKFHGGDWPRGQASRVKDRQLAVLRAPIKDFAEKPAGIFGVGIGPWHEHWLPHVGLRAEPKFLVLATDHVDFGEAVVKPAARYRRWLRKRIDADVPGRGG